MRNYPCKLIFGSQQREFDFDADKLRDFAAAFPANAKYRDLFESIFMLAEPEAVMEILRRKRLSSADILRCFEGADSAIRSKLLLIPEFIAFMDHNALSLTGMDDGYGADLDDYETKLRLFDFITDSAYKEAIPTLFLGERASPGILTLARRFSDFNAAQFIWDFAKYKQNPFNEYRLQMAQGNQEKVILKIGGREFLCELEILLCIAHYCIKEDEENRELVQALINIGHPLISSALIWTELFDLDTLERLWDGGSILICRKLAEDWYFFRNLSDRQVEEIMMINDYHIMTEMAYKIYLLYEEWEEIQKEGRLSMDMRDKLLLFIIGQEDDEFLKGLSINMKFFPAPYRKMIKNLQKELIGESE